MFVVVGLGNPGTKYDGTRHNIGFAVLDAIAASENVSFKKGLGEFSIAVSKSSKEGIALVKPMTYMNNSGSAVARVVRQYDVPNEKILIISDDYQLPLGKIRIRLSGSASGHNGLISIIAHLKTDQFARLRCGIGGDFLPKAGEGKADYVLNRFSRNEQSAVSEMIQNASDAALMAAVHGVQKAMNKFNTMQE